MRLSLLFLAIGVASAAPTVSKVEPPNWWAGHSINPVRVLIRGTDLKDATVSVRGLRADNVTANANGHYLFVDISIPANATPGDYPLQIKTAGGSAIAPFSLDPALSSERRFQGFSPDDVIYLIMPDRFSDGDPSNNNPSVSPGMYDPKNPHYYHGGDFQGIIDHLPYLKELGVTAIWMTPVYDNTNHLTPDAFNRQNLVADYHGYGAVDYYAVEEHFGSLTLLRKLVDEAHRLGIKVIQDQVANHTGPDHPWVKNPPDPSWFHGTPANHLTETFNVWDLIDPHAPPGLIAPVLDGWFADALPDLNQGNPEVAKYEIQNALWWVGAAGFDGIRQDTLPYVDRPFWSAWSAALKRQYPKLRSVGEVLDSNPAITSFFLKDRNGVDTVFDYPGYFSLRDAFAHGKSLDNLIKMLANDYLYPDPASLVTILGDHDVSRFMSEPNATLETFKLAWTFLLTSRGIPVIYYGDEIGMKGGDDPDNRHDFPKNAFTADRRTAAQSKIFDFVAKLNSLRHELELLRRGEMINLTETSQAWVYARRLDSRVVLVALNNGNQAVDLEIRLPRREKPFRSLLGTTGDLVLHDGIGSIHLPAFSEEIYADAVPAR